jgi:hypothetical protein
MGAAGSKTLPGFGLHPKDRIRTESPGSAEVFPFSLESIVFIYTKLSKDCSFFTKKIIDSNKSRLIIIYTEVFLLNTSNQTSTSGTP